MQHLINKSIDNWIGACLVSNICFQKLNTKFRYIFLWICLWSFNSYSIQLVGAQKTVQDNSLLATNKYTFDSLSYSNPITIPTLIDWQDSTVAFSHGSEGEWDHYLWGGFANSLIKKDNRYYLYYQGSPSYDNQCESVSHRGIGVATSTDGIHWIKSQNNPVISWSNQGSIEEGAVSSAVWLGKDGKVYVYYGANTGSGCTVSTNARLAVSEDGEHFQELGEVLSASDPNVWGFGDEIFPVGAYSYENRWYLYYIPNGVSLSRKLGIAVGDTYNNFTNTMGLNNATISSWGPVSTIVRGSDAVLITNPGSADGLINIYRFSAENPSVIRFHASYTLPECRQSSLIFESSEEHWMMSCRDGESENYLIKHAYPVHIFADVPTHYWAWRYIESLYNRGVTSGCNSLPLIFCPTTTVTRDQMAVFLLRAKHGSDYVPPAPIGLFEDVPTDHWAAAWIEQLAAEGISSGCSVYPAQYCPTEVVSRDQMAVFLLRAKYGSDYKPPAPIGVFTDVPSDFWAASWIEQLAAEKITGGCSVTPSQYCPAVAVSRDQMAVFLVRSFELASP
jgi:hypothetical protein